MTVCLVTHTVILLLHNLELTHFRVTHALKPRLHAFHARLKVRNSLIWVTPTPSILKRFTPKYLEYFAWAILVPLDYTGQVETQHKPAYFFIHARLNTQIPQGWRNEPPLLIFLQVTASIFPKVTLSCCKLFWQCHSHNFHLLQTVAAISIATGCFVISNVGIAKYDAE